MCGILAITGKKTNDIKDAMISDMLVSLAKRGPDDKGFLRIGNTVVGQTRLSIVDLATGHQPMRDNKHPYTVVFNGEIYGYKDVRRKLETQGHIFSTTSDTEVILKAYAEYGQKCVDHLDGMFVFTIWDESKQELFIARDRFGKKPFYYTWKDDVFFGASEIKALFATGLIKGKIDPEAVDNYLQLMYIPPYKTIYSNINTLPPAHAGIVRDGKCTTWRYWQLKDKPIQITYDDAKTEIKRLFDDAVQKRMVADVEIGSLLSGGVDSTLVTAYAQKYTKRPIKTFSISYDKYIDELPYAKQASEKIGTDHYSLNASSDLTHELEKIIDYMDEPHADSSDFPQHLISEFAASKVKVALSGDGADELFMGYGWYWKYWHTRKITRLKNMIFSNQFKEHLRHVEVFSKKDRLNLWKNPIRPCAEMDEKKFKSINLFDLSIYLPGQLLTKIDRTSMMHSLEVRSPFLDYRLAEFVYNLPEKYKMDKKNGKIILKDILAEIMPKEFVYRRKQGFGAPITEWLKEEKIKKYIHDKLGDNATIYSVFKEEEVKEIIKKFYNGKDNLCYKIWSLLCLELWFEKHKKYHE